MKVLHTFSKNAHTQLVNTVKKIDQGIHPVPILAGAPSGAIALYTTESLVLLQENSQINSVGHSLAAAAGQIEKHVDITSEIPQPTVPPKTVPPKEDIAHSIGEGSKLKPLGRGSTEKSDPKDLTEQIVMKAAVLIEQEISTYYGALTNFAMTTISMICLLRGMKGHYRLILIEKKKWKTTAIVAMNNIIIILGILARKPNNTSF